MSFIPGIRDIIISLQREKLRKERELRDVLRKHEQDDRALLLGMIENLDNLQLLVSKADKYLALNDPGPKRFVNSLKKIEKGILEQLSRNHVTLIEFCQGDEPTPHRTVVVDTVKTSDSQKFGKISEVIKKGYSHRDKILRFTHVTTYAQNDDENVDEMSRLH